MKWVDSRNNLDDFITFVNSFHHSTKFTTEISSFNNTFLDTTSTLVDGKLDFNLYTKPTDSHLYLMTSSCHPPHTFRGIPKGLATRVRRICSTQELYSEQSQLLKSNLCARGYSSHSVQNAIDDLAKDDRLSLLKYKPKNEDNKVPFVTTYHPVFRGLNTVLKKNLPILYSNDKIVEVFKKKPDGSFQAP